MKRFICLSLSVLFIFGAALSPKLNKEKSHFLQNIKDLFHYHAEDTQRPKPKEYPPKFDKMLKKELKYPPQNKK